MFKTNKARVLALLLLVGLLPGLVFAQAGGWEYQDDWYYRYGGVEVYAGPHLLQKQVADGTINRWRGVQVDASGGLIQAVAGDDTDFIGVVFGGKTLSSGDVALVAVRGETDAQVQGPVIVNDSLKVGLNGQLISWSPSTTYGAFAGESNQITQPGGTGTITVTASASTSAVVTVYGVTGGSATSKAVTLSSGTSVTDTLSFSDVTAVVLDEAEASATITATCGLMEVVFTAGQTEKGLATLSSAQGQGHNLQLNVVGSGSTTKYVVVRGTNSAGSSASEVFTMNGTTSVAGSTSWAEISQIEVGHLENTRTATFTHDEEPGAIVGKVLEAGDDGDVVRIYLEPDKAVTTELIPFGAVGSSELGHDLHLEGTLRVDGTSDLRGDVSDGAGDFTIADNVVITGTSDLQGNVSDSGGTLTFADDIQVTGASDLVGDLSDSGGDLTIADATVITSTLNVQGAVDFDTTLDVQGDVSDSGGTLTFADDAMIDGAADAVQLTIQGNGTQTSDLLVLEASDGTDILAAGLQPAANSSGDIIDVTTTLNDVDGTDTVEWLDVNITQGTATNADNVLNGINLALSSASGNSTETGIVLSGWDIGIDMGGLPLDLDDDNDTSLRESADDVLVWEFGGTDAMTWSDVPAANSNGDSIDFTDTLNDTDGTDTYIWLDLNLTQGTAGGASNVVTGLDLALSSAQAAADETGIVLSGWDVGLDMGGLPLDLDDDNDTSITASTDDQIDFEIGGADHIVFAIWPAVAGSGDVVDVTETATAMDGSDALIGIDLNLIGADHAGTGNSLVGIDLSLATPDEQVTEKAVVANDSDWDVALDAGDIPIVSTAQTWMEDFFGDAIPDEIAPAVGTDPQCVTAAIESDAEYGVISMSSGDDNAGGCAASCAQLALGTHWQAANGGTLIFEARFHFDTDIDAKLACLGLTDNAGLEMPATIGGGDARSWSADDAVVFCYDSAADTDEWFALSRAGTTEGTGVGATGVAPVADTWQIFRIEVDNGGADARFYIDGSLVGTVTANAVTAADLLTPVVVVDTNEDAVQPVDIDYVFVSGPR